MALSLISLRQAPIGINAARGIFGAARCSAVQSFHTSIRTQADEPKWVGLIDGQNFEEKNKKLNRPLSGHLTVYRWNVPMTLSITNRITGAFGAGCVTAAGIGLGMQAFGGEALPHYIDLMKDCPAACITSGKFALAFPFVFHSVNGIRHLTWDSVHMLTIGQVEATGYVVSGVSVALTAALVLGV